MASVAGIEIEAHRALTGRLIPLLEQEGLRVLPYRSESIRMSTPEGACEWITLDEYNGELYWNRIVSGKDEDGEPTIELEPLCPAVNVHAAVDRIQHVLRGVGL